MLFDDNVILLPGWMLPLALGAVEGAWVNCCWRAPAPAEGGSTPSYKYATFLFLHARKVAGLTRRTGGQAAELGVSN